MSSASGDSDVSRQELALGIVSLVMAIPITIVLAVNDQLAALLIAWIGIAVVNLSYAWQGRRP